LIATSPLSFAALIAVEGWSVMPTAFAGLLFVLFVYLRVSFANLLVLFAYLAVVIKRLRDRDKSAWWLLLFSLVASILQTIAYYNPSAFNSYRRYNHIHTHFMWHPNPDAPWKTIPRFQLRCGVGHFPNRSRQEETVSP
jgi:uncharacterized membrane protein YhaH (DUF805 family)